MSKAQCKKNFKKRNIRKALVSAGVPINMKSNVEDDEQDYNDDDDYNNSFTRYISNITQCDARCRAENRRNEILRMNYQQAKTNVVRAPIRRNVAEKDYYTAVYGEGEYIGLMEDRYKNKIKQITDSEREKFNDKKENILLVLENYENNIELNSKLNELIEITLMENNELIEKIDKISSTINTNERKTYYDEQQIKNLKKWKVYTMRFLFILYVVIFISIIVVNKNNLSFALFLKFTILLLIPLLLIPMLTRFLLTFYNFINKDASNMSLLQLISKLIFEFFDEFKLFFTAFYTPMELLVL